MNALRSLPLVVLPRLSVSAFFPMGIRKRSRLCLSRLTALVAAFTLCTAGAWAATLTVNTTADSTDPSGSCGSGTCSLRDAITQANADAAGDTITFSSSATGTITLTSGPLPAITQSLTIEGPGANQLTISGAGSSPIFGVTSGDVTISGMTFTNSNQAITVSASATVAVQNCVFTANTASASSTIVNNGTLNVVSSTFSGNSAQQGGALFNASGASMTVADSTFTQNSASAGGGAIQNSGTLTATNNTFYANSAPGGSGGAIFNASGTTVSLSANNNIFANNTASTFGAGIFNASGDTANASYNVYYNNLTNGTEDDCNGCTTNTNATSATANPLALPLADYGGTTQTFLPLPGSAAICAGSLSLVSQASLTVDQRGFAMNPGYNPCAAGSVDAGAVQTNYIQVKNSGDAGAGAGDCPGINCTLRDAIALAYLAGDVDFASGITTVNLTNTNGGLTLDAATGIEIVGPGANSLTINGNGSSTNPVSVFTVNSGTQAMLYGLTVTGGNGAFDGGGVNNLGTLLLAESAIADNVAIGNGGGVSNDGTVTVLDSTISGNSANDGGGIYSVGARASITESTISGNSVGASGVGGGIFNSQSMAITGSTIWGNSNSGFTGGLFSNGTLTLANSIVANNSGSSGFANINGSYTGSGDVIGGGDSTNTANAGGTGAAITMSGLQLNGASDTVPTLIPLPGGISGNPVICAGSASNLASGITTDERGYPVENTTYTGFSLASPCVDAGAVQTNYSMSFTTSPKPATGLVVDQGFGAEVTLDENGAAFAESSVSIPVTITSGTLYGSSVVSGTASESTSAGVATFSSLTASVGSGDMLTSTLSLNAGLATPLSLTASSASFDVAQANTSVTSLSPASQSATVDNSVSFAATVAPSGVTNEVSASNLVPMTGKVTFFDGGSAIGNCTALPVVFSSGSGQGTVTCATTELAGGSGQMVTAQYISGDTNYAVSPVSSSVSVSMNPASTSMMLTSNTGANSSTGATGSSAVNQSVTFTATVSAPAGASVPLKGNVMFTDNGSAITSGSSCGTAGVAPVTWSAASAMGTATCTTSALIGGTHAIVAAYNKDNSDSSYLGSNNNVTELVGLVATTVSTPTASPSSPTVNQTVTVTATVAPSGGGTPTVAFSGSMEFFNNGTAISNCAGVTVTPTATGATASCPISGLTASSTPYLITAQYKTGDPSYSPSLASSPQSLMINQGTTGVTVSSSQSQSTVNQQVTFTATVTPNPPGGVLLSTAVVNFTDSYTETSIPGCATRGVTVNAGTGIGQATCTTSALSVDTSASAPHAITAAYGNNDPNFQGSSGPVSQVVSPATIQNPTLTSNIPNGGPIYASASVTFQATFNPGSPIGFSGTGTVTYTDTYVPIGQTTPVTNSITGCVGLSLSASCSTSTLPDGVNTIIATYSGDPSYNPASAVFTQQVEDYSIILNSAIQYENNPAAYAVYVTQGSKSTGNPFGTLNVSATSLGGFSGTLTITCTPPSTAGAPACILPASSTVTVAPGTSQSAALSFDATNTNVSPGNYPFTVTTQDPASSIQRKATYMVVVLPQASPTSGIINPVTIVSGASGTGDVSFGSASSVTLSNLSCQQVSGTNISGLQPLPDTAVNIACSSFAQGSSSPNIWQITVTTETTNGAAKPLEIGNRHSVLLVAGLFVLPLFGLVGIWRQKSFRAILFRTVAVVAIGIGTLQMPGCGGSYQTNNPVISGGTTPPGTYYILVQGTGSDKNTYQAVLQVNVDL
jgi:CSLREA domain-containing protein